MIVLFPNNASSLLKSIMKSVTSTKQNNIEIFTHESTQLKLIGEVSYIINDMFSERKKKHSNHDNSNWGLKRQQYQTPN